MLALLLAVAVIPSEASNIGVLQVSTGAKPINACRVAYAKLTGTPTSRTENVTSERTCFFLCPVATSPWWSYDAELKTCECYVYGNITDVLTYAPSIVPTFAYQVYGNIQKCFPFCSVAVRSCDRCRTKKGGVFCVHNFSARRCCCVPPSKPIIRNGAIAGCTKATKVSQQMVHGRSTMERRSLVESLSPFYQVTFFDDAVTTEDLSLTNVTTLASSP